ncbi:MFS transporter [Bacillus sp. FSL W7-1360]
MRKANFWYLFSGRLFSNIGDSIYYFMAMWLAFELTGSPLYSGIALFLTTIPSVFQFLTGPYVDRTNLKSLLVITQFLQFILLLTLPILFVLDVLTVHWLLLVMFIASCVNEFAYPAQSALLPRIVEKNELMKANTYMRFAYQGTDILFMAVAGVLLVITGAPILLFLTAFLFLLTSFLFTRLKITTITDESAEHNTLPTIMRNYRADLKEGVSYVKQTILPSMMIGPIIANAFLIALMANLPAIAAQKGGPAYYGAYMAAFSVGMLLGTASAPLLSRFKLGALHIIGFIISGIVLVCAAIVPSPVVSIIFSGMGSIIISAVNVVNLSIAQRCIEERILGRVSALLGSAATLAAPLGALIGGFIGAYFSPMYTFVGAGVSLIFVSLHWLSQPLLRKLPKPDECELALDKQQDYQMRKAS